jgi:ABC-type proline/glycine betaine transport system permease subunit
MDAAVPAGLLVMAAASAVYALRCLADRMLAPAFVYSVFALGLLGVGGKAAVDAF